jgi:hypothetical protein
MLEPTNDQATDNISSVPTTGTLTVVGEDPRHAVAPIFANFVAISHLANEVQLEFIFLDINTLAGQIEQVKRGASPADLSIQGKTVAKVVVPAASFVQLRSHLSAMFDRLEGRNEEPQKRKKEAGTEGEYGN